MREINQKLNVNQKSSVLEYAWNWEKQENLFRINDQQNELKNLLKKTTRKLQVIKHRFQTISCELLAKIDAADKSAK